MARGLIVIGVIALCLGCDAPKPAPFEAPKPILTTLSPDKYGVYPVPKGTTVADLGIMVPGTYTARKSIGDPLDHLDSLSEDRRKAFTGFLILADEDPSWQLTFQFAEGKFVLSSYKEMNKEADPGRPKVILKNGATIAEAVKVFPAKSDVRFYSPIILPPDSASLAHFTGYLGRLSAYPSPYFILDDGKVGFSGANSANGTTLISGVVTGRPRP